MLLVAQTLDDTAESSSAAQGRLAEFSNDTARNKTFSSWAKNVSVCFMSLTGKGERQEGDTMTTEPPHQEPDSDYGMEIVLRSFIFFF